MTSSRTLNRERHYVVRLDRVGIAALIADNPELISKRRFANIRYRRGYVRIALPSNESAY